MKQRSTTPVSKTSYATRAAVVACAVLVAIATPIQMGKTAFADNYDDQIQTEQRKQSQNDSHASVLGKMADSYQAEVDRINTQIGSIQTQINNSQDRYDKYQTQIEESKQKITENKKALSDTISDMYVDSGMSTLEMLASSKNIGDYVDKQAQQESIQSKLNKSIDQINALKKQIEAQQKAVAIELENQKAQRAQLASVEAAKQKLVNETRGQEAAYRQQAKANNDRIQSLRAAQAEENRRAAAAAAAAAAASGGGSWSGTIPSGVAGGGGYPWGGMPLDAEVDPWGLYTSECVSYTAWKVASTKDPSGWRSNPYKYVRNFMGAGNAYEWPSTTSSYAPHGSEPRAGSVAIWNIGYYGHAMYVESVNSDGTITVSDYNLEWDGLYRKYTRSASGLTYIYF